MISYIYDKKMISFFFMTNNKSFSPPPPRLCVSVLHALRDIQRLVNLQARTHFLHTRSILLLFFINFFVLLETHSSTLEFISFSRVLSTLTIESSKCVNVLCLICDFQKGRYTALSLKILFTQYTCSLLI